MKAVLFAAGLGTRLKPFTEKHPKALALVNNKTLLERNIRYLQSFGINDFIINIHHFGEQILEILEKNNNFGSKILISDEREEILETGGGLLKMKPYLQEASFLVMNVDILTDMNLEQFIQFHQKNNPLVSLAVSDRDSSRKLYFDSDCTLKGWKNYKAKKELFIKEYSVENTQPLAFSGIHLINSSIFNYIMQEGKFSIMDVYLELMNTCKIIGFRHSSYLIDVGKPESILEAEKYFK